MKLKRGRETRNLENYLLPAHPSECLPLEAKGELVSLAILCKRFLSKF